METFKNLRSGNIIFDNITRKPLILNEKLVELIGRDIYNKWEPIVLTEKEIKKIGFKKAFRSYNNLRYNYSHYSQLITISLFYKQNNSKYYFYVFRNDKEIYFEYLHELQNYIHSSYPEYYKNIYLPRLTTGLPEFNFIPIYS